MNVSENTISENKPSYADVLKYNYTGDFKRFYSFTKRINEGNRIISKFPDRVPIIVEQERNSLPELLDKRKYLVPTEMTVGQFMYVIRKRMKLASDKGLYMFFDGKLFPTSMRLDTIYKQCVDEDKFLYATVGAERTFG